jgi:AcrR family transcriptional regulator
MDPICGGRIAGEILRLATLEERRVTQQQEPVSSQAQPPRRADARRNYERLLATAEVVFTEHGPYASLDEIAKRAAVGNATLYRHFPTRQALLEAVHWNDVEALCLVGRELADSAEPGEALATWLRAFVGHVTGKRGLASALVAVIGDDDSPMLAACHQAIRSAGIPLLERAQQAGAIRPDININELLTLTNGIVLAASRTARTSQPTLRLVDFLITGIQSR